jgi:hypothetical protein
MRTFIKPTQDATIYQRYPTINSGLDEIIEIGKVANIEDTVARYATASSRILLDFDIESNEQYPINSKYYLNLRIANATRVNRYQQVEVYPVSHSWIEGSGYFYQDIENVQDGVSWQSASATFTWETPGADYDVTSVSSSYTFTKFPIEDIKIDVTDILEPVVYGTNTVPWNGLLLKFPTADEENYSNVGNIKFFSSNTHTVFSPTLEILWTDQSFITGSLKPITNSKLSILPKNLKESYIVGEIDKVYLVVRDQFPDKRFDSVQRYKSTYFLPSESYFRIRDVVSGVTLYDFDLYSAVSCDATGSYFVLDTTYLEPDRYYSIDLKVKSNNLVFYPNFNYEFKVDVNA